MARVYLTNYNLRRITKAIDRKYSKSELVNIVPLINDLKSYFSDLELSRLYIINAILSDDKDVVSKAFKYKKIDSQGAAYHTSTECRELNKNFIDLIWDENDKEKVRALNSELSQQFKHLIYLDIDEKSKNLKIPETISKKYNAGNAIVIMRKNSGHLNFSNVSQGDIIQRIKNVLSSLDEFKETSNEKHIIEKLCYGTDRWHVLKANEVMKECKRYKDEIEDLIITFFRIASPTKTNATLLDSLNLTPCRSCMGGNDL